MPVSRVTALPPGAGTWFLTKEETRYDPMGNPYTVDVYSGEYVTAQPYESPSTGVRDPLPSPVPPSYATPPTRKVATTEPMVTGAPGSRNIHTLFADGLRIQAGDLPRYSTGPVSPMVATGWDNAAGAIGDDGNMATTDAPAGTQSAVLTVSGFNFNIPENAVISGIKVTVKRRLL